MRTLTLLLVLLFGAAYGLFTQDPNSNNTLCRAAMTANMVQHGRIDINGYETFTRDKAFNAGNYYCDKAPGMTYLAAPAAFAFTRVIPIGPEDVYGRTWTVFMLLLSLTTSGALCILAGVMLFHWLRGRTKSLSAAFVGALAFGLGTSVWGWATSMFSHAGAAALLVAGFILLDRMRTAESRRFLWAALAGLALGGAVAIEYTAFIPALIMGAAFALTSDWRKPLDVIAPFAAAAAAAVVTLLPVLWFHAAAFGSPFTTGYAYTVEFTAHQSGIFGIGAPRLEVIGALLVGFERGFTWYAPIVLVALWAAFKMLRVNDLRVLGAVTLLIFAWYLVMNAGFEYWHGGASTGPRYLTPALGFSAIALGMGWTRFGAWERRVTVALLVLSIGLNFAFTAVDMTVGGDQIAANFFAGDLKHTLSHLVTGQPGVIHFIPPLAVGAVLSWLIWREAKRTA